jgi:hypothetical protein
MTAKMCTLALVVAASAAALTVNYGLLPLLALAFLAVFTFSASRPHVALAACLIAFFAPLSVAETPTIGGIDVRLAALPFMAIIALQKPTRARGSNLQLESEIGWTSWAPPRALFLVAAFAAASTLWSIDRQITVEASIALAMAATLCTIVYQKIDIQTLTSVVGKLGIAVLVSSAALVLVAPGLAYGGERVRGVFSNANGLGAFLVIALPAMLLATPRARWLVGTAAMILGVVTGSRATVAALTLEIAVFLCSGVESTGRRLTVLGAGTIGAAFVGSGLLSSMTASAGIPLLRQNNSREETWELGMYYFYEHPWLGAGVDAVAPGAIGGIGPGLLAATGIVGTFMITAIYVAVVVRAFRSGVMYQALVVGATADLIFEPWLITGGSLLCVVFWLFVGHPGFSHRRRDGEEPILVGSSPIPRPQVACSDGGIVTPKIPSQLGSAKQRGQGWVRTPPRSR